MFLFRSFLSTFAGLLAVAGLYAQQNSVPFVNGPLVPDSATPGSAGFTLTVNGTGFVSGSVVKWNGSSRATAFVSSALLTATILATDVAAAGTASVIVDSPPPGGGASNLSFFVVTPPRAAVAFAPVSPTNDALVVADVNGDGKLDLLGFAFTTVGSLGVSLGNGDGTFQPQVQYPVNSPNNSFCPTIKAIAMGDFNGDGKLDAAAVWSECNELGYVGVAVFLGNGDGTFQADREVSIASTSYTTAYSVAVGDFDNDGKLDIAATYNFNNTSYLVTLLGKGDGTFTGQNTYTINGALSNASPFGFAIGDFNHDGKLDLAIPSSAGLGIWIGNGDGTFQQPLYTSGCCSTIVAADFNGDGLLDVADAAGSSVLVFLGKGDGTFNQPIPNPASYATAIVAGDFNGDGKLDLAVPGVEVLLGNGDGTFAPAQSANTGSGYLAADFNGDGLLDLLGASGISLQTAALVSPTGLGFPFTLFGKTTPAQALTVSNVGTAAFNVTQVGLTGPNPGDFGVAGDTCSGNSISPSGKCSIAITFTPTTGGSRSALLNILNTAVGGQETVTLYGTATVLRIKPGALNFGNVKVGSASGDLIFRVINESPAAAQIRGVTITGHDKGDFYEYNTCGKSLSAKSSCGIVIQFIPMRKGLRKANITVDTGGNDINPNSVSVAGTGT